jgi:hypothetical protein
MNETNNIKHIFNIIIEIIYTLLGLDKLNNKPDEFTKETNSQNITNDAHNITLKQLIDHIMKSYNDFMGIEGLTNNKNNKIKKEGFTDNVNDNDNNNDIMGSGKKSGSNQTKTNQIPSWAKTSN